MSKQILAGGLLLSWCLVLPLPSTCLGRTIYGGIDTSGIDRHRGWTPGSGGGSSGGSSSYDSGAAQRAQEAAAAEQRAKEAEQAQQRAEAERRAEEKRKLEAEQERQRVEAENQRRIEELARQVKFEEERDADFGKLRGSGGVFAGANSSSESGLRGSTGYNTASSWSGGSELRGSGGETQPRSLPNLDPMVVDARNVPTGLPKFVEDNIPNTPAGNRVRKGYQAIKDHDWNVARAWFQDALNHDPGDDGIKRLAEWADFMVRGGDKPPQPARKVNVPTPAEKAQIEAVMKSLEHLEDQMLEEIFAGLIYDYGRHPGSGEVAPGGRLQLPAKADLEFLMPPPPAKPSRK